MSFEVLYFLHKLAAFDMCSSESADIFASKDLFLRAHNNQAQILKVVDLSDCVFVLKNILRKIQSVPFQFRTSLNYNGNNPFRFNTYSELKV
jgi:hypothetical protein